MEGKSKYDMVFEYLKEFPNATNDDIAYAIGTSPAVVKTYISRLRLRGFIKVEGSRENRQVIILEDITDIDISAFRPRNFKQKIYAEMIEIYLDDFMKCEDPTTKFSIGKEIRLLFREM